MTTYTLLPNQADHAFLVLCELHCFRPKNQAYILQVMKTPPTSYFVKKALSLEGGSQKPGHSSAGQISLQQIYEIAKVKQQDQPFKSLESVCRSVIGTCQSMGIQVKKPALSAAATAL